MKKIGILTINDYNNYGNRLQNYALQEILKILNVEVETVVNKTDFSYLFISEEPNLNRIQRIIKLSPRKISEKIVNKLNQKINENKVKESFSKRRNNFLDFTRNNIIETNYYITEDKLEIARFAEYDYFITGSDQVWNPNFRGGSYIDFLTFAPPSKRVSYAASFGVSQIPENYVVNYSRWLSEMSYVSVREETGAKIVRNLTGRDVPVLADPTLILSKEQWLNVSKKASNRPDTPYLLTYFLGGPSKETQKNLEKLAQEKNMTIINLGDITERETYETGPSEFLDYINNASAFFTDSFHGVVFSIIFETPFLVYERQSSGASMYSRIETILDNFDMRNREADGFSEDIFTMDFSGTYEVIDREYNKSIKYLKEALRIEE